MGRPFFGRPTRSVEVINAISALKRKLRGIAKEGEIQEYVMPHHLLLCTRIANAIYLQLTRHHRQLIV